MKILTKAARQHLFWHKNKLVKDAIRARPGLKGYVLLCMVGDISVDELSRITGMDRVSGTIGNWAKAQRQQYEAQQRRLQRNKGLYKTARERTRR